MKKLLIIILLNLVCNSAFSEPSEKSWLILEHHVSIMDWALIKLKEDLERRAETLENDSSRTDCPSCNIKRGYEIPPILVTSYVTYNGETDKIIIGFKLTTYENNVDIFKLCEVLRDDLAHNLTAIDKFSLKNQGTARRLAAVNFVDGYFSQFLRLGDSLYDHIVDITDVKVLVHKTYADESVLCFGNIIAPENIIIKDKIDVLWNKHFFR